MCMFQFGQSAERVGEARRGETAEYSWSWPAAGAQSDAEAWAGGNTEETEEL